MNNSGKTNYLFPLIVMASLFFLFGFITTMNNSTIDFLKNAFGLNDVTVKYSRKLGCFSFVKVHASSHPFVLLCYLGTNEKAHPPEKEAGPQFSAERVG